MIISHWKNKVIKSCVKLILSECTLNKIEVIKTNSEGTYMKVHSLIPSLALSVLFLFLGGCTPPWVIKTTSGKIYRSTTKPKVSTEYCQFTDQNGKPKQIPMSDVQMIDESDNYD